MKSLAVSKRLLRLAAAILALILLAGCSSLPVTLPESPFLRNLERKSGKIVFLGLDGNLYTTDQGGTKTVPVTVDADGLPSDGATLFYQFPTWSSDGNRLAYVKIRSNGQFVENVAIIISNTDGSDPVEVFNSAVDLPVYLFWSPDDKSITYLSLNTATELLSLNLVPAGGGEIQKLGEGYPLYWDWRPQNDAVAVHTGGDSFVTPADYLSVVGVADTVMENELDLSPTLFKAPAYSPEGEELLMAAKNDEEENAVLLLDSDGNFKEELAIVEGPVAFGWSPDGEKVAFIDKTSGVDPFYFGPLKVIEKTQPDQATTVGTAVLGFFWSPDGEKIAYFEPLILTADYEGSADEADAVRLRLSILDVSSGASETVYEFVPSQSLTNILPASDQYQHSVSFWSPDSRKLVLTTLGEEGEPLLIVVDATGALEPRLVGQGIVAYWSWR